MDLATTHIGHPLAAANTDGLTGVYRIYITGSLQTVQIPKLLRGKFVSLTVNSANDVQYAFGVDAAPALVQNQLSDIGVGHASAGKTIFSKTSVDRIIPKSATWLSFIGTAGGGYLEIECSEVFP